jgi:hypothetical protein
MVQWIWTYLGVTMLPEGETAFVLTMWDLLDRAVEDEVRHMSLYRQLQEVSCN